MKMRCQLCQNEVCFKVQNEPSARDNARLAALSGGQPIREPPARFIGGKMDSRFCERRMLPPLSRSPLEGPTRHSPALTLVDRHVLLLLPRRDLPLQEDGHG